MDAKLPERAYGGVGATFTRTSEGMVTISFSTTNCRAASTDRAPQSYASRALLHRKEDLQRCICLVLRGEAAEDWVAAVRERVPVFRNQPYRRALACAERLGAELPGAGITDLPPPEAVRELRRRAVGDVVSFADRELERASQAGLLA